MEPEIEKTLSSLHSRHIQGIFAENAEHARQRIMDLIYGNAVVGIGDSTTMRQLGIPRALKERGIKVIDPFERKGSPKDPKEAFELFKKLLKDATVSDVFVTGTSAVTQDGKLANLDAVGNRVAGMFWGHPTSIIVVGRNKIVKDLEEAQRRIKTLIAPNHVRIRVALGGINSKTPCAATGECSDCRSKERICNILTVIEGKPFFTDIHVVIVNEDLGLAWDPSWPEERVARIVENYKKLVWVPIGNE